LKRKLTLNFDKRLKRFSIEEDDGKSDANSDVMSKERFKSYFQYNEIGQIKGILREKFNLW
jgi:hypothetical protein